MTTTQDQPISEVCLTSDKLRRLAPELLAMRDGLTEIATGLVNAYPSETHVLRVTVPLTRATDHLFATVARLDNQDGAMMSAVHVEDAEAYPFYDWARRLRLRTANRLWMVPKPGLLGEEHVYLASELLALQLATLLIAQELRRAKADAKTVKAACGLRDALANLTAWLCDVAWNRQKFPADCNPYISPRWHPKDDAKAVKLLETFAATFNETTQETAVRL